MKPGNNNCDDDYGDDDAMATTKITHGILVASSRTEPKATNAVFVQ